MLSQISNQPIFFLFNDQAKLNEVIILLISLLTIFASGLGAVTGFGTSTIMVPVLVTFLSVPITLLVVGIIHWFSELWRLFFYRRGLNWRLLFWFGLPGMLGSLIGAILVFQLPLERLTQLLGLFLVGYTLFLWAEPGWRLPQTSFTSASGGILSGFLAGIFGIGGAIRTVFLTAFGLAKEIHLFTGAAIGILIDSVRLVAYHQGGISLPANLLWGLVIFIPASWIGTKAGERIVEHISQRTFRRLVTILLFLIGVKLVWFS